MIYGKEKEVDYLAGSKPSHIIPDGTPIDEMVYYVLEDSENNFNEMMKNIGVDELDYFIENGVEIDYTAINEAKGTVIKEKIKTAKDDMAKWLQSFWSAFQEMIQKVLNWFSEKASDIKKRVIGKDLTLDDLKNAADHLKKDKDFGEVYEYSGIDHYMNKSIIYNYGQKADSIITNFAVYQSAKLNRGDEDAFDQLKKNLDNQLEALRKNIVGSAEGVSDMTKAMKKQIRGNKLSINGKWVTENWNHEVNIIDKVLKYSSDKKTLKSNYDDAKKMFDKVMKSVKDKKNDDGSSYYQFEAMVKANSARKKMLNVISIAENATVSCLTERYRAYSSIVLKVTSAARSAKAKTKGQGSTSVSTSVRTRALTDSATIDMLDSIFDW